MQERRRIILQELEDKGSVKVNELSRMLGCSEVTVRSDIRALEEEGKLVRIHGGAVSNEPEMQVTYRAESLYRHVELKKQIAARAYEFIKDRDTIIIDDASSSFYLGQHIRNHPEKQVAVVTNSLLVGNELAGIKHVELYLIGGHVGGNLAATMGEAAVDNMKQFHVDKAFIGVHGINFKVGITSIGTPQMQVKRAILEASKDVYVLADSSKFGGGYLSVICPIDRIRGIITDNQVSRDNIQMAKELHVPMIIA